MTDALPRFESVSVREPPMPSPSESLPGEIVVVDAIASSMSSMPAPCRWTMSRNPSPGCPDHGFGSALFWSTVRKSAAARFGRACISSAAAPATCGDAIEVPLIVA